MLTDGAFTLAFGWLETDAVYMGIFFGWQIMMCIYAF